MVNWCHETLTVAIISIIMLRTEDWAVIMRFLRGYPSYVLSTFMWYRALLMGASIIANEWFWTVGLMTVLCFIRLLQPVRVRAVCELALPPSSVQYFDIATFWTYGLWSLTIAMRLLRVKLLESEEAYWSSLWLFQVFFKHVILVCDKPYRLLFCTLSIQLMPMRIFVGNFIRFHLALVWQILKSMKPM